jgi:regulator of protease activity HflC (stomatin/prohibitin superfamily)
MAEDDKHLPPRLRAVPPSDGRYGGAAAMLLDFLRGRFFRIVVLPLLVLAVGFKLLMVACLTYVGPNEYGIKVVRVPLLGKRGVHEEVYQTGFHVVLKPFDMEQMYLFPKDLQVLDLTGAREEAAREASVTKPAHIQTSDGFFVDVDVSILYRITDPYLVFTHLGTGNLFETAGIVPKAEPVLKQTLGELTTEEFYNSPMRVREVMLAKDLLNKDLNPYGITVDQIVVRYFRYTEEIQKNIEERKLKDQLVFKNQAEQRAAIEGAKLKKVIQEGQVGVDIALQQGAAYVTQKEADRDLYVRSTKAEADLLIKLAEAKRTQLRNDALQGAGSDRLVGLKMAEVYDGLQVLVLPSDGAAGVNPLDLEKTMRLFGIQGSAAPARGEQGGAR